MSDPTIFGSQDKTADTTNKDTTSNPSTDFIGEGKKYKTEADAIASIPHAQKHIDNLEKQIKEMRDTIAMQEDKLKHSSTVDDLMNKIDSRKAGNENTTQNPSVHELTETVERIVEQRDASKRYKENALSVTSKLTEMFGDQAEAKYIAKANELGLDVAALNELSRISPKAVLEYFNVKEPSGKATVVGHNKSVNTEMLLRTNNTVQPGTFAYYETLRKENPSQYFSTKVQRAMISDLDRLGEAKFYGKE